MDKSGISLKKLATHFEAYNRSEGKSPATIYWYFRVLTYFQNYLRDQKISDKLGDLSVFVVRDFILYLQTKNKWDDHPYMPTSQKTLSAISVQTYVRALKAFFNWLYREGYTDENILADLKPPKAPNKLVEVLKDEEVKRILSCINTDTSTGSRGMAIVITMLDTGLRLSEVTNLKMADAHIEEGSLKVMGKGSKERIVPLGGLAQKVLLRYVYHFRPEPWNSENDTVFLTVEGRSMTNNAIKQMLKRISIRSGVKRLHPHLCRHTFATNYLINGGDVFSLQQILGHTSLEMVRRYVTLASAQVRVQHRKFSPMDRMNLGRIGVGRMIQNGSSNGNGLVKKHHASNLYRSSDNKLGKVSKYEFRSGPASK